MCSAQGCRNFFLARVNVSLPAARRRTLGITRDSRASGRYDLLVVAADDAEATSFLGLPREAASPLAADKLLVRGGPRPAGYRLFALERKPTARRLGGRHVATAAEKERIQDSYY